MDSATDVGSLFTDSYDLFKQIKEETEAAAFIAIYNYSPLSLTGNNNFIRWGKLTELPVWVHAGEKEGLVLRADKPAKGIEGLIGYKLPDGYRFFVYVKIKRNVRDSHGLGICLAPAGPELDGKLTLNWYNKMKSGKYCLDINSHKINPRTMQCCHDSYCLQVSMTTGHQANVTVRIIPKDVTDFAVSLSDEHDPEHLVNQANLDQILKIANSCNHPNTSSEVGNSFPKVNSAARPKQLLAIFLALASIIVTYMMT